MLLSDYCFFISVDEVGGGTPLKRVENIDKHYTRKNFIMGQILWSVVKVLA